MIRHCVKLYRGIIMKSYIINLDRRADRMQDITDVFNQNNIDFIRVSAVDGKEYAKTLNGWKYPMTPPEVGCFYSHIKCFELIASGDDEYGVVFEDDVILSKSASYYINNHSWIPGGADIIKIETFRENKKIKIDCIQSLAHGAIKIGRLRSSHLGTGGYIISKKAAKLILSRISCPSMPIDNYLFMLGRGPLTDFSVYQLMPAICKQKLLESTIDTERSAWHAMEVEDRRRNKVSIGLGARILREITRPLKKNKKRLIDWCKVMQNSTRIGRGWRRVPFE